MPRFRVLVTGEALVAYLGLPLWGTARAALRLLADEPRPRWAARTTSGFVFYLPDETWVAYDVDEQEQLVTVLGAGERRDADGPRADRPVVPTAARPRAALDVRCAGERRRVVFRA